MVGANSGKPGGPDKDDATHDLLNNATHDLSNNATHDFSRGKKKTKRNRQLTRE